MTRDRSESQVVEAYRWAVREGRKVSPTASDVLTVILTYTDLETGMCFPKRKTISEHLYDTGDPSKSQLNTISDCLRRLVAAGLLEREQSMRNGRMSANVYVLNVGSTARNVPSRTGHVEHGITGHVEHGITGYVEHVITGHHEVSKGSSKEVSRRSARARGRHLNVVEDS